MAQQQSFNQFPGGGRDANRGINPNDLSMSGAFISPTFSSHAFSSPIATNQSHGFSSGSALFGDDELLDGLASPAESSSVLSPHGQDYGSLGDINMTFSPNATYSTHRATPSLRLDHGPHINGFSHAPDCEPIHSPFVQGFATNSFRRSLGPSLQSPISYSASPHASSSEHNLEENDSFLRANESRIPPRMQRKSSDARSPLTPKSNPMHALSVGSQDSPSFGAQPIRTTNLHDKLPSSQWIHSPGNMALSYGSAFSSPLQSGIGQINEVMMKGGTSMPAKLGVDPPSVNSQEMKRKRRRESHNLVERRRRDNINERIHDLSRLVPTHRLEDEKIRKMIQNGTPMSPGSPGMSRPSQTTAGPSSQGPRRPLGITAGNITTGLPIEDRDKGPNKGDILNGAVSWTRDLMWMLHLKLQQQEELINCVGELGGHFPFELTEDEKRMQTELMQAMAKNSDDDFSYSRTVGSGLRVPHHTDFRGDPVGSSGGGLLLDGLSVSPCEPESIGLEMEMEMDDAGQFWHDHDDDGAGTSISYKEEDEY